MPQLPANQLRARPDYYVLRLKKKAHKETVKSKLEVVRLHSAYRKEVGRIGKSDLTGVQKSRSFTSLANEFCDRFEERLRKRVSDVQDMTADETQRIMNLCLPKGTDAPGHPVVPAYWTTEFKGQTPDERLARVRLVTVKRMRNITSHSFQGAVPITQFPAEDYELAVSTWDSVEAIAATVAGNEPWIATLLTEAATYKSNEDVIDHYEFLATLDELTCEECGAHDGMIIEADQFGLAIELTESIDFHPG